jgi:hypothetical protein
MGTDDHEPASPDVPGFGVHNGQRKADGHRGIHRIASPLQDVPAYLARDGAT